MSTRFGELPLLLQLLRLIQVLARRRAIVGGCGAGRCRAEQSDVAL
jgi:hypothetical protein